MAQNNDKIEVYLESSQKKTFAVALDWPGWCRSGRDEATALQTLYVYGPRYARAIEPAQLGFQLSAKVSDLEVVERVKGDTTTEFGTPGRALRRDAWPVEPGEQERWVAAVKACWQAFDAAVQAAAGKTLSKGPRGGGRDLEKIVEHVLGGDDAYLVALGGKFKPEKEASPEQALAQVRQAMLETLAVSVRGEIPERGPRGGLRWKPRDFVRRWAWHELDHAWEIEDRIVDRAS
jgi:hypothetical protein